MPTDRRRFVASLLGAGAAAALPPGLAGSPRPPGLPAVAGAPDERYWRLVREQFSLSPDLVLMNAANLCPAPRPVQEALLEWTRDMDRDASFHNRGKYGELREASRAAVAATLGTSPDEVALTRNTSEGNNAVVRALDLGAGDEVVLWDQNHPTNLMSWRVEAERRGFTLRTVSTPPAEERPGRLAAPFLDALGPRTRVLAFSHVSNVSGTALPAAELCAAARRAGAHAHVDGAQTWGVLEVDVEAMGCDSYSASAHKWIMGPREVGVLYVRRERQPELWPNDVGVGWESAGAPGGRARRFESLGQRDDAAVAAVATAVAFRETLGAAAVEARTRSLVAALRRELADRLPGTRFHTPADPSSSAGVLVFRPPGIDVRDTYDRLYREKGVGCAAMGGDFEGLRLSPHVYNTMDEVDRVVEAVASLA